MDYRQDIIAAKDGSEIILTFYAHASVGIAWDMKHIYIDPVGEKYGIDFSLEKKACLILLTHQHSDHLDSRAIVSLSQPSTTIIGSKKCADIIHCKSIAPFTAFRYDNISIETIPAYNITEGHLKYHPEVDGGLGYILTLGGTKIYIAGDTEDNKDILALRGVDIAFLPVNQPYTMTLKQVENVVKAIRPAILYPYHLGTSDCVMTDVSVLAESLNNITEVRIRNMI